MAQINANLQDYEEYSDLTPVPPGEYVVRVTDSVAKEAKSSGNLMAEFTLEILGPTHAGRRLWDRFVMTNDVARRRLKTFAKAAGHKNPNFIRDTEEFHGLKALVKVKIEEKEGYAPKNVISSYKPVNGAEMKESPAQPPGGSGGTAEQEPTREKRPWEK